jgi:uncharacterized Zn finger protein (UPF0148 family)
MTSFLDYLSEHERKLDEFVKPKPKQVHQESKTSKQLPNKSTQSKSALGKVYSICSSCGTKQKGIVAGEFCPVCGKKSLRRSDNKVAPKSLKNTLTHAEALLDDGFTEGIDPNYVSPLSEMFTQKTDLSPVKKSEMLDHAADLLEDSSAGQPLMSIPMPDFSSVINRNFNNNQQPEVIPESVINDPSLQLINIPVAGVDGDTERQMRELGLL